MRLCIDPGHGGLWPSKRNLGIVRGELVEKNLNLLLAQELRQSLPDWVGAWLTRSRDRRMGLSTRGRRSVGADLTLSIHINGHHVPSVHGLEAYHWHGNATGHRIAQAFAASAPEALQRARVVDTYDDPSTSADDWIQNPRAVVGAFPGTAVLVEIGHATNESDHAFLMSDEGRSAIVIGLRAAVIEASIILGVGEPDPLAELDALSDASEDDEPEGGGSVRA